MKESKGESKCYHAVGVRSRNGNGHPPGDSLQELLAIFVHLWFFFFWLLFSWFGFGRKQVMMATNQVPNDLAIKWGNIHTNHSPEHQEQRVQDHQPKLLRKQNNTNNKVKRSGKQDHIIEHEKKKKNFRWDQTWGKKKEEGRRKDLWSESWDDDFHELLQPLKEHLVHRNLLPSGLHSTPFIFHSNKILIHTCTRLLLGSIKLKWRKKSHEDKKNQRKIILNPFVFFSKWNESPYLWARR